RAPRERGRLGLARALETRLAARGHARGAVRPGQALERPEPRERRGELRVRALQRRPVEVGRVRQRLGDPLELIRDARVHAWPPPVARARAPPACAPRWHSAFPSPPRSRGTTTHTPDAAPPLRAARP